MVKFYEIHSMYDESEVPAIFDKITKEIPNIISISGGRGGKDGFIVIYR